MIKKSHKPLVVFLLSLMSLLLIVLVGLNVKTEIEQNSLNESFRKIKNADVKTKREEIRALIYKLGPQDFHSLIKKYFEGDLNDGHTAMHLFGEELYKKEKEKAIGICDDSLGYGCFHGVAIEAISQKGIGVMSGFDTLCHEMPSYLGCTHGLGHGIQEYLGPRNLTKALEICDGLSWKGKLHGCQEGVFMEYNFPNTFGRVIGRSAIRKFDASNPYYPCNEVGKKNDRACFYGLGMWWIVVTNDDLNQIGNYCADLKNYFNRRSCFLGVGLGSANRNDYDALKSIEYCKEMPTSEGNLLCRAGVRSAIEVTEGKSDTADKACSGLGDKDRENCLNDSVIKELIG